MGFALISEVAGGKMAYRAFGELLGNAPATTASTHPYLPSYAGYGYDSESGQYHTRHRQLDPSTGRFMTKDPISFAGGDANLYRYVLNDPIHNVDPSGLSGADVNRIMMLFNQSVAQMTNSSQRTDPGYANNILSTLNSISGGTVGSPYQGCKDQAGTVQGQMQATNNSGGFDDLWVFVFEGSNAPHSEPQSSSGFNILPHWWIEAHSSNKNDPVLLLDPFNNIFMNK